MIGLPRAHSLGLATATATVLCLHAGLLLLRPDVSGSSQPGGARAMAVRWLPSQAIDVEAARDADAYASLAPRRELQQTERVKPAQEASDLQIGTRLAERFPKSPAGAVEAPSRVGPAAVARSALPPPAPSVALGPRPAYLFGAQLDPGPRPLGDIQPEYPESANLQEGKVVLRLLISETGVVDDVAVVRAEPTGLFENAALEAFRVARFSPGMVLGTPVKSQITVEVDFLPINRGARISGRMY